MKKIIKYLSIASAILVPIVGTSIGLSCIKNSDGVNVSLNNNSLDNEYVGFKALSGNQTSGVMGQPINIKLELTGKDISQYVTVGLFDLSTEKMLGTCLPVRGIIDTTITLPYNVNNLVLGINPNGTSFPKPDVVSGAAIALLQENITVLQPKVDNLSTIFGDWNSNKLSVNCKIPEISYSPYNESPHYYWLLGSTEIPAIIDNDNASLKNIDISKFQNKTISLMAKFNNLNAPIKLSNSYTIHKYNSDINISTLAVSGNQNSEIEIPFTINNLPVNKNIKYTLESKFLPSPITGDCVNNLKIKVRLPFNQTNADYTLSITIPENNDILSETCTVKINEPICNNKGNPSLTFTNNNKLSNVSVKAGDITNPPSDDGNPKYYWMDLSSNNKLFDAKKVNDSYQLDDPNSNLMGDELELVAKYNRLNKYIPVSNPITLLDPLSGIKLESSFNKSETNFGTIVTLTSKFIGKKLSKDLKGTTYKVIDSDGNEVVKPTLLKSDTITNKIFLPVQKQNNNTLTYKVIVNLSNGETISSSANVKLLSPTVNTNKVNIEWNNNGTIKDVYVRPNSITNAPYNGNNPIKEEYYWEVEKNGNTTYKKVDINSHGNCYLNNPSFGEKVRLLAVYEGYNKLETGIPLSEFLTLNNPDTLSLTPIDNPTSGVMGQKLNLKYKVSGLQSDESATIKLLDSSNDNLILSKDIASNNSTISLPISLPFNLNEVTYKIVTSLNGIPVSIDSQLKITIRQPICNDLSTPKLIEKNNMIDDVMVKPGVILNAPENDGEPEYYWKDLTTDKSIPVTLKNDEFNLDSAKDYLNHELQLFAKYKDVETPIAVSNSVLLKINHNVNNNNLWIIVPIVFGSLAAITTAVGATWFVVWKKKRQQRF